ncbi:MULTISPECIES: UDP-3-O-(3-hydroxymyristoyl)glucosamine N-acyltransferase [Hydrogenophaga]|uniref:UDP-3-O-acylglucosamine N-acyltransferase n=1 Tax=Hydrogenophaga electricum TaxID=1230953 RepID=A0ABQ6BYT1_9BURK|nr:MULTISPECIES: UDP-3-O-(3-hydroxymyristoyl)glucosamine N-acyltransferase [Hydrogenophaga]GLS12892.1 UDP-3-O-acylglucosamine N-acyltransferase [Hydrogenophaga electricum]
MTITLGRIVAELGGRLVGDGSREISGLASLAAARVGELSFVSHPRYAGLLADCRASAVIVPSSLEAQGQALGACVVADDPYLYFARLTQWWRRQHEAGVAPAVDATAHIHPEAHIGVDVSVGPFAVIGARAVVGPGARIGAHSVLGDDTVVGAGTRIAPRVTVGDGCRIGERCILHPGVVIGADGFGFAPHKGQWIKIEQLGAVHIGNDVEIGANTCIDRGALEDTVIGDGVKLDNLIQIGHNVRVGAHTAMAGCVGVAGSATIGERCTVGGGAVVLGHLSLADDVHISAASVVTRSIRTRGHYTGMFPIDDNASWEKNAASLKQLNRLRERLKAAEQAIEQALQNKTAP